MASIDFKSFSEDELSYALFHAVDEIAESQPGLREMFPEIRSILLDKLCERTGVAKTDAEKNISQVPLSVIKQTLKALLERDETKEIAQRWISRKPTDYVQSVDPITGAVLLAGIYFVLTTNITFKYKKREDGSGIDFELKREKDVPHGFIKSLIDWFRGLS